MGLGIVEIANPPQGGWPQISRLNPAVGEEVVDQIRPQNQPLQFVVNLRMRYSIKYIAFFF